MTLVDPKFFKETNYNHSKDITDDPDRPDIRVIIKDYIPYMKYRKESLTEDIFSTKYYDAEKDILYKCHFLFENDDGLDADATLVKLIRYTKEAQ